MSKNGCRALIVFAVLCCANAPLLAQESGSGDSSLFARVSHSPDGNPAALQIAIVRYVSAEDSDVAVDLIGAVHIGDAAYYQELNRRFQGYDALLYELIAPPGTEVPSVDEMPPSFISSTQMAMRSALGLAYQLEIIDYAAANFVHADLSPDELAAHMQARGESLYVYFWRAFYAGMAQASRDPLGLREFEMLASAFDPERPDGLKITMAYELANFDAMSAALDGRDGSALIASRNQRAVDVLKVQLAQGRSVMGIFYGVAHMPDMARRLQDQLGLVPADTEWLDAWRLDEPGPGVDSP